jgi:hypothetical protein
MTIEFPKQLTWLIDADRDLAQAKTLQEFKALRDRAREAQLILKVRGLPLPLRIYAAEIRLIAARRAGQEISKLHLSHGGRPAKSGEKTKSKKRWPVETCLKNLGISTSDSYRWQRFARIPQKDFFQYLEECRQASREATREGLLQLERWLRNSGTASGLTRPAGGEVTRRVDRPPPNHAARKLTPHQDLRDFSCRKLDPETVEEHRKRLREFLRKLLAGKAVAPEDAATLRYISRICRELLDDLNQE